MSADSATLDTFATPEVSSSPEVTSNGSASPERPVGGQRVRKVAIVGFTHSRNEAPYGDPEWELWGINNLHKIVDASKFQRWYDLHDAESIKSDNEHDAWLRTANIPVYTWDPRPEWPSAVAFPKAEITGMFGRYFTNSVSWMLAHAIAERVTHISVFGIDMATGGEYASQRPSCEYFIGLAIGLGIEVQIPDTSDLLKSAELYGEEGGGALRKKLQDRDAELKGRLASVEAQHAELTAGIHQLRGAIEANAYILGVWTQPEVKREDNAADAVR